MLQYTDSAMLSYLTVTLSYKTLGTVVGTEPNLQVTWLENKNTCMKLLQTLKT
jgi:hypothetical protein